MRQAPPQLSQEQLDEAMRTLPRWSLLEGKLHREYSFKNFVNAFAWMSACAMIAEKMDHHPEWSNVWSKVVVDLQTHESGGVTELDLRLARKMEKMALQQGHEG